MGIAWRTGRADRRYGRDCSNSSKFPREKSEAVARQRATRYRIARPKKIFKLFSCSQRMFYLDQIVEFVGERGHFTEGIGNRMRLALGIHRDRCRIAQGIGNRCEIALGIVAERGGMVQRIGDRGT